MQASNFLPMRRPRSPPRSTDSSSIWVDKYEPRSVHDTGVNKQKIKAVDNALKESAIANGMIKLLFLTGPTGCGKSTLVRILCRQYGYEITEWNTPLRSWSVEFGHMASFRDFMHKAITFNTLENTNSKKVILMDDIPDLLVDEVKKEYFEILQSCLSSSKKFLIIVIASDSYTVSEEYAVKRKVNHARIVAPDSLKVDPHVKFIEFNPLTKLNMINIVTKIVNREGMSIPHDCLESLVDNSNGDIRSAINALQFSSNTGNDETTATSAPTNPTNIVDFDKHISKLSLFHAVGKVVYAKRNADDTLESKPDHIINKLPVDNDYFIDYIHQNCIGHFQNIQDCSDALDDVGFADALRSEFDWLDSSASYYRGYVSIHGIMKPRRRSTGITFKMAATMFEKAKHDTRKKSNEAYKKMWLQSVALRNSYYEQQADKKADDDEFEEIFGDGSDLAELEF